MKTDKFTLFVCCNFLVLLNTIVCSQNINKQNVADETLTDYSFLSWYHYTKSKDYLKRRYRIRHWISMFIGTPCSLGTQLCLQTELSLLKPTHLIYIFKNKLRTFSYQVPQSKFEANRSKGSQVMIGQTNSNNQFKTFSRVLKSHLFDF